MHINETQCVSVGRIWFRMGPSGGFQSTLQ